MKVGKRSAARVLVESLQARKVDRVFCVPGESYLSVLDALVDAPDIQVVACRHEGGAGFMAVADAKLSHRPGLCMVSRGPGAMNAAIAVHVAEQDAVPLILLVGQVARVDLGRGSFQEVDYAKTFSDMAKWTIQVMDAEHMAETIARAWTIAQSGTPGPVVVVLPEDMLEDMTETPVVPEMPMPLLAPPAEAVAEIAERLGRAERPVLIAGGDIKSAADREALHRAAEAWQVPVLGSFKRQDLMDNDHPLWAGVMPYIVPKPLADALAEADLVLAVGTRLGDVTTQNYAFPKAPVPAQPLIHVYPDPARIGRNFATSVGVGAHAGPFLAALGLRNPRPAPAGRRAWAERLVGLDRRLRVFGGEAAPDSVDFGHIAVAVAKRLPEDAIVTTDAGNFAGWFARYISYRPTQRAIGWIGGAMGGGMPSAVAAALRFPGRKVVTAIGDGGLLMTGSELATAVQYGAAVKIFVSNNGAYGTIRMHQGKQFPGRPMATALKNPDFAAWARSFGAEGLTVIRPEDADGAVAAAMTTPGPVVVDVKSSLRHVAPGVKLAD
jgi:acetolactate synthase-1/2/3 large subunit